MNTEFSQFNTHGRIAGTASLRGSVGGVLAGPANDNSQQGGRNVGIGPISSTHGQRFPQKAAALFADLEWAYFLLSVTCALVAFASLLSAVFLARSL